MLPALPGTKADERKQFIIRNEKEKPPPFFSWFMTLTLFVAGLLIGFGITLLTVRASDTDSGIKPSADVQFNDYLAAEFESRGMYKDLLPVQVKEQLHYMACGTPEQWGVILHDMYQTYLHRHPTVQEYEEVFNYNCTLKERSGVEKAQERVLKKMRKKLNLNAGTQLTGKKVLVTGGSRGVGFALSVLASEMGATVVTISRSKDWYDWTKSAATGDNSIWDSPYYEHTVTTNRTEAAVAWGVPESTLDSCMLCPLYEKVHYINSANKSAYKLPQDHLPFYWGLTGVQASTFDNIHHFETDVRSREQLQHLLDVYLPAAFAPNKASPTKEEYMPDYVFYNAATETAFYSVIEYSADALDTYDISFNDNVNDTISSTPHIRYDTAGIATSRIDYEIGVGAFMYMLRHKFGKSIKDKCTHVFSSSGAAATALQFGSVETQPPYGIPFDSSYASHYGMTKHQGLHLFAQLREEGWRTVSMQIMGNNGMVNYNWVHGHLHAMETKGALPSGTAGTWDEMPMAIDKIDKHGKYSDTGKWIGGMNANGYQMYHSWTAGGYAGGGWYVSVWSTAMRMWKNMLEWPDTTTTNPTTGLLDHKTVCWPRGFILENKQDIGFVLGAWVGVTKEPINVWRAPYMAASTNLDFSKTSSATFGFTVNHIMLAGQTYYTEEMTSYLSNGNKSKDCNALWAYDYPFLNKE